MQRRYQAYLPAVSSSNTCYLHAASACASRETRKSASCKSVASNSTKKLTLLNTSSNSERCVLTWKSKTSASQGLPSLGPVLEPFKTSTLMTRAIAWGLGRRYNATQVCSIRKLDVSKTKRIRWTQSWIPPLWAVSLTFLARKVSILRKLIRRLHVGCSKGQIDRKKVDSVSGSVQT